MEVLAGTGGPLGRFFSQYLEPVLVYATFPSHLAQGWGRTAGLWCLEGSAGSGDVWLREDGRAPELVPWLRFTGT